MEEKTPNKKSKTTETPQSEPSVSLDYEKTKTFKELLELVNLKPEKKNYRQLFDFYSNINNIEDLKQYFGGNYQYIINNYFSGIDINTLPKIMKLLNNIEYIAR
jgi:hypothetical protein